MASLRRSRNSQFYIACITLPSGRRTNRSTKTGDRRVAQKIAEEWQAAADRGREGRFVETQARKVLNDILGLIGQDSISNETVESFMRQWLSGKDGNTARRYASTVDRFLEHLREKKTASVSSVGHKDILAFIAKRELEGVAPKTLSVDVRTLSAAFNVARKLGLVNANPAERASCRMSFQALDPPVQMAGTHERAGLSEVLRPHRPIPTPAKSPYGVGLVDMRIRYLNHFEEAPSARLGLEALPQSASLKEGLPKRAASLTTDSSASNWLREPDARNCWSVRPLTA